MGDGLARSQHALDDVDGFQHSRARLLGGHAEQSPVGRQTAAAHPVEQSSMGQMIQKRQALGHQEGIMVGQVDDAGTQLDSVGQR